MGSHAFLKKIEVSIRKVPFLVWGHFNAWVTDMKDPIHEINKLKLFSYDKTSCPIHLFIIHGILSVEPR